MPPTQARGAFGTKLYRGNGESPTETFTEVPECHDFAGFGRSHIVEDATNMSSPDAYTEKVAVGLKEAPTVSFDMHLVDGSTVQANILADLEAGTRRNWRLVRAGGTKRISFAGFVSSIGESYPRRGVMMQSVTIEVTGKPVLEAHS